MPLSICFLENVTPSECDVIRISSAWNCTVQTFLEIITIIQTHTNNASTASLTMASHDSFASERTMRHCYEMPDNGVGADVITIVVMTRGIRV